MNLNNEQDAIRQAREAGYVSGHLWEIPEGKEYSWYAVMAMLNDPRMWQALGKARGWPESYWRYACMQYFENLLLRGGDTNKFFQELP